MLNNFGSHGWPHHGSDFRTIQRLESPIFDRFDRLRIESRPWAAHQSIQSSIPGFFGPKRHHISVRRLFADDETRGAGPIGQASLRDFLRRSLGRGPSAPAAFGFPNLGIPPRAPPTFTRSSNAHRRFTTLNTDTGLRTRAATWGRATQVSASRLAACRLSDHPLIVS